MPSSTTAPHRAALTFTLVLSILAQQGSALAQSAVRIDKPAGGSLGWLTHPYQARSVPQINLGNSSRFDTLIRAGNLYLSAQDVVALAIENNLDVEVQRYAPLLAREVLRRAEAGGVLRSVGVGVAQGPQSVSIQGVSTASSGLSSSGGGVSSGGGILTQLGPGIASFDPAVSGFANFAHSTTPQSNTFLTGTTSLVADTRSYQVSYSQSWDFGLNAQMSYGSNRIKLNSQFFSLNPYTTGDIGLSLTQNLLQGFGSAVNGRNIRVQKNNLKVTDLQFKLQLIATVSSALNLYWDLVSFHYDVRSRQQAVDTAQQLLNDNKRQVEVGSLAEIEITRAESQLYAARQDLVIARTNLLQQETILKNALSRSGVGTADLAGVHIVPLDSALPPSTAQLPAIEELVNEAVQQRPELQQARINLESNKLNLVGIKSSLKPSLQAFAQFANNGLTGELTQLGQIAGIPETFVGGYGNLLNQIVRRHYPNYSAGVSLNIPLRNRAAQSDYATSLVEIRQNELVLQKNINQIRVDVQNAVIGLEQASARFEAAAKARDLAAQTLAADQKRFNFGAATAFQVVQDQRDLSTAQSSEVQAMANYSHARIAFEQAVGRTLAANNVSIEEAMRGALTSIASKPAQEVKP